MLATVSQPYFSKSDQVYVVMFVEQAFKLQMFWFAFSYFHGIWILHVLSQH